MALVTEQFCYEGGEGAGRYGNSPFLSHNKVVGLFCISSNQRSVLQSPRAFATEKPTTHSIHAVVSLALGNVGDVGEVFIH